MDARIQRSVIANLSQRPRSAEIGPFMLGWDPATDSRHINYATPLLDAAFTKADVDTLVAAFREFGGVPRLEYVTTSAPDLERLLLDAGFSVEERHEYLICTPDTVSAAPVPPGFTVAVPESYADRAAQVAVQNEAFGGAPVASAADIARLDRLQQRGGVALLIRDADGRCVAGGQATPQQEGMSEVGGIATAPGFRRRGLAGALTAAITERVFAAGADVAWLEASGDDSWRVYERVGYVPSGKRLYIALD